VPIREEYKIVENDGITPIPDSIIENFKVIKNQKGTFKFVLEWVVGIILGILCFLFMWFIIIRP